MRYWQSFKDGLDFAGAFTAFIIGALVVIVTATGFITILAYALGKSIGWWA